MTTDPAPPAIHDWLLPYETQLEHRPVAQIDLVVIHCTELPDLAVARQYGERPLYESGTGNSGHYYVDRDGSVHMFVRPTRTSNHTRGFNQRSVGIELVNLGRYPDWHDSRRQTMREPYADAQVHSLLWLLAALKQEFPKLQFIAGHEDLDTDTVAASDDPTQRVFRKRDPGPMFPWPAVLAECKLQRLPP